MARKITKNEEKRMVSIVLFSVPSYFIAFGFRGLLMNQFPILTNPISGIIFGIIILLLVAWRYDL